MSYRIFAFMVGAVVVLGAPACGGEGAAPAKTPAALTSTDEADAPATDIYSTIDIDGAPPIPVLVDGKPAGTTPVTGYKVAPGTHSVTFVDTETGNRTMEVTVGPGEGTHVSAPNPVVVRSESPSSAPSKGDSKPSKGDGKKK